MRTYLTILLLLMAFSTQAQTALTDSQKRQAASGVKQTLDLFQSSFAAIVGLPEADQDPVARQDALNVLQTLLLPDARFENDLTATPTGSNRFDFKEFYTRINLIDYPKGLNYELQVEKAQYGSTVQFTDGRYLMFAYLPKSFEGLYQKTKFYRKSGLCRIAVYFDWDGQQAKNCRIGFVDNDTSKMGATFSEGNPMDFQTLDETLEKLANQLAKQVAVGETKRLRLETFSYDDKKVLNAFSNVVTSTIQTNLRKRLPSIQIDLPTRTLNQEEMSIQGYYREEGNFIKFYAQLLDRDGKPTGPLASNLILAKNMGDVASIVPIAPEKEKLDDATKVNKTMENVVPLPNSNGLTLDIRTDKGVSSLVYQTDDLLWVYAKSNQPCYVRLVYRQNSTNPKEQLVLLGDFQLPANQEVEFPNRDSAMRFICSDPYGPEFLIAYASTVSFGPINTKPKSFGKDATGKEITINYILDDLATLKKQSVARAFKTLNGKEVATGVPVVEKKLQITTRQR